MCCLSGYGASSLGRGPSLRPAVPELFLLDPAAELIGWDPILWLDV